MAEYLLPCPACGDKQRIDSRQAGETVHCKKCGEAVTVPTLRGLRDLEPAEVSPESRPPAKANWSVVQGVLFSMGLLLAIVAGLMSARHFLAYGLTLEHTQDRTSEVDQYTDEIIDNMPLSETMQLWAELRKGALGDDDLPPWEHARRYAEGQLRAAWIWFAFSAAGMVAVLTSLVMGKRPAAAPR